MKHSRAPFAGLALIALVASACAEGASAPTTPAPPSHNGGLYGSGGKSDGLNTVSASSAPPVVQGNDTTPLAAEGPEQSPE